MSQVTETVVPPLTPEQRTALMDGLRGQVRAPRASVGYRLAILLVMFAMLMLPVVYLLLIAAAALGVFWYATHAVGMLTAVHVGGRAMLFLLILYLAPIGAGGLLVLFMFRPLFARTVRPMVPITLNRQQEPILFEFADRTARLVGAPLPKRICISYDVNAAASFGEGWLSMLGGDLALTIGVPLAGGLTVSEFGGVLAHEFGHFSQGAGMRLSYVVRTINMWLARQVYERDTWDVWVMGLLHSESHWSVNLVGFLAALMVGISRIVLRVLMIAGHTISCFLLRHMEYNADRYQIGMMGSTAFARAMERVTMLSVAESAAFSALMQNRMKCQDICALISSMEQSIPREVRQKIQLQLKQTATAMFDSHPSMRDRVLAAVKSGQKGFFHDSRPATILFSNFAGLSRMVTVDLEQQRRGTM